jgi:molybdopterin-guanine dinucleotide biosynthesis protein A
MADIGCAILAGGKSTRLGRDKASIRVFDKTLIQQVYEKAQAVFKRIFIVSNHHEGFCGVDVPIVKDVFPAHASMVGIASALLFADTPYVFILGCDMPFVSVGSIECVLSNLHGEDIIIPHTHKGFEPLHAVYSRACISIMLTHIGLQRFKIRDIFPFLKVREIEENPLFINGEVSVFTNINVEEDLNSFKSHFFAL